MLENYLEKVYSGIVGMNIGIRLGAPIEPAVWTCERIRDTYGDITGYVKEYKNFAADDDANGPVYFLRALRDDAKGRELRPGDVARAWLNYTREGVGMFWWGGYGISTEHTAYLNLKNKVPAPQSGSISQNGKILAEQIGGQIFIDTWGLCFPGDPQRAAQYGEAAASVSHDGEGINGARFFCACIARAFESNDILHIIETGLAQIPSDSDYAAVSRAVLDFYRQDTEDFRACRDFLEREWGYDRFGGVCHIIPNAGVCILAMLYGKGDFARTVEIAAMCGWDTDCNAGNVGTVLGVMCGLEGLPWRYRKPINDGIVLSGISGYLNILDLPSFAREVAAFGYELSGQEPPKRLRIREGEICFDFELPGSTHNMRSSNPYYCTIGHEVKHIPREDGGRHDGQGGMLKVLVDRLGEGERCRLFYKPFYTREDFSDERYSPVFSPTVYSGQKMSMRVCLEHWGGLEAPGAAPYIRTVSDKKLHIQGFVLLKCGEWMEISCVIPDVEGDLIDEAGIVLEGYSGGKAKTYGVLYLDEFRISGDARYTISIGKQSKEFGTVTPFSVNHGAWEIVEGKLSSMRCEEAFAYAGNYYAKNYSVRTTVEPLSGRDHLLLIRAQGAMRGYALGLSREGKAVVYKNDFGFIRLSEADFVWKTGETYEMEAQAFGERISLFINGKKLLEVRDESFTYGMYGCGSLSMGRTLFGDFEIVTMDAEEEKGVEST